MTSIVFDDEMARFSKQPKSKTESKQIYDAVSLSEKVLKDFNSLKEKASFFKQWFDLLSEI